MNARDVRAVVEEAADPFRREVNAGKVSAAFAAGFWEGLNVALRAIEAKLREEGARGG